MLNCIVCNRNGFDVETVCKQKPYLHLSELFEIELFICIKVDLTLDNLQ